MTTARIPMVRSAQLAITPGVAALPRSEAPGLTTNTGTIFPTRTFTTAYKTTPSTCRQEHSRTPSQESVRNSSIINRTAPAIIICCPRVLRSVKAPAWMLRPTISRIFPGPMAAASTLAHTSGTRKFALLRHSRPSELLRTTKHKSQITSENRPGIEAPNGCRLVTGRCHAGRFLRQILP